MKKIYFLLLILGFHCNLHSQTQTKNKEINENPKTSINISESVVYYLEIINTKINELRKSNSLYNDSDITIEKNIYKVFENIESARKLMIENSVNLNSRIYFESKLNEYEVTAKNLLAFKMSKSKVSLIGDAALVNSNKEDKTVNGIGLFGLNFVSKNRVFEISALINLIGSKDTVVLNRNELDSWNTKDFGRSILNPFSGSNNFLSGLISSKFYLGKLNSDYKNVGFLFHIGLASQNWKDTTGMVEQANIFVLNPGLFWNVLSKHINLEEEYQFITFANLSIRAILGDVSQNNNFRSRALGSDQKIFYGFDIGFQLKFNQFTASLILPFIAGENSVKGITDGQFMASISVYNALKIIEF